MQLDPGTGGVAMVLRERDQPARALSIMIAGEEAVSVAAAVNGDEPPRPEAHDLLVSLLAASGTHVDAVEVTNRRNGALYAELSLRGPIGDVRLDSRPSDAIALALRVNAPIFVAELLLAEVDVVIPEMPDDDHIEQELEEFRARLDQDGAAGFTDQHSHEGNDHAPPSESS